VALIPRLGGINATTETRTWPISRKFLAMPSDRRRGLDDVQRRAPVAPDPGEQHPQQTVGGSQLRPFPGEALKDTDLVLESHVLQLQHSA
jgi:hypothetical protein